MFNDFPVNSHEILKKLITVEQTHYVIFCVIQFAKHNLQNIQIFHLLESPSLIM